MVEYQWERTKFFDTEAVLDILPAPLRTQVLLDINKTFMFTVPFFQDQDEAIIKQIVQALGHELVLPGTLVVHEGQPADKMYFSRFGEFEVLAPHSYVVVQNIKTGGYLVRLGFSPTMAATQPQCVPLQRHAVNWQRYPGVTRTN